MANGFNNSGYEDFSERPRKTNKTSPAGRTPGFSDYGQNGTARRGSTKTGSSSGPAYTGENRRSAQRPSNGQYTQEELERRRAIARRRAMIKRRKKARRRRILLLILLILLIGAAFFLVARYAKNGGTQVAVFAGGTTPEPARMSVDAVVTPTPTPTPEPTPTPTPTPKFDIPHAIEETRPENFGYTVAIEVNGMERSSYTREDPIKFDIGYNYTDLEGIITFRGNNFRTGATYGTANVKKKELFSKWTVETGEIMRGGSNNYKGTWTGSLWTGQPLVVKWPESTKRIMNMYDSAKNNPDLVEVIYATASGRVYFLNLETGKATRDPIDLNMPFKGAGALDPRGYPLLYLGSGDMYDDYPEMQTRAMVVSLIDGTVLYEFGKAPDPFAIRYFHAYDSSPLVSAETDTLIYPGENGIIYFVKLGTQYDEQAGTISVNPSEVVKYRYNTSRSSAGSTEGVDMYWLGVESSATCWGEYLYFASNDGFVHCVNMNTLEPVWIRDVGDDANGSLVLEEDETRRTAYLYAGPTLHFTHLSDMSGTVPFYKLDAVTGEVIWKYERKVLTNAHARGGIQATAILGKGNMSNLVIIPFERTYAENDPENDSLGWTVALDKYKGTVVWEKKTNYAWSSPLDVYDENGNGYVIQPDSHGNIYLFDGLTGKRYAMLDTKGKNFEASGVVYGDMLVIGNKDKKIFGIRIV